MQDYQSSLGNAESRKFETFSYLPAMNADQTREQIQYIINQGWNPSIEHTEPEHAAGSFWYMWKLPMFGETEVDAILTEIENCKAAHPNNHIRLLGLDNFAQCAGASMVIHRGNTI